MKKLPSACSSIHLVCAILMVTVYVCVLPQKLAVPRRLALSMHQL